MFTYPQSNRGDNRWLATGRWAWGTAFHTYSQWVLILWYFSLVSVLYWESGEYEFNWPNLSSVPHWNSFKFLTTIMKVTLEVWIFRLSSPAHLQDWTRKELRVRMKHGPNLRLLAQQCGRDSPDCLPLSSVLQDAASPSLSSARFRCPPPPSKSIRVHRWKTLKPLGAAPRMLHVFPGWLSLPTSWESWNKPRFLHGHSPVWVRPRAAPLRSLRISCITNVSFYSHHNLLVAQLSLPKTKGHF